ncbi:hypothetical protein D5086_032361 [Populus alba]|uniref:Uncharacterized protein n=2 Tax=Populus TaxID=3689 RepID=A0ACC4ALX2_POPAL|nr:calcium uptake protein 1-like [Populus alba x Populus x berolinensis]
MGLMRAQNRQGASHRDGRRFGLKVAEPVENGGLLECFFGKDGRTCLQQERFVQFLKDFHDEILRLAHYDYRSCGTISAKDFALSLVASADIRHISKLLDRVVEVSNEPQIRDIRITFEEFKNFAELRRQLRYLSLAIFSYGKVNGVLTKKDIQRASSQVCGISITNDLVDIIFHVFDANRDGNLSSDEFIEVKASWIAQKNHGIRKHAQTPIQHVFAPSSHTKLSHLSLEVKYSPDISSPTQGHLGQRWD